MHSRASHNKIMMDVTELMLWHGPPVGIIRVQLELARHLAETNAECGFFVFSHDNTRIAPVPKKRLMEKMQFLSAPQATVVQPLGHSATPGGGFVTSAAAPGAANNVADKTSGAHMPTKKSLHHAYIAASKALKKCAHDLGKLALPKKLRAHPAVQKGVRIFMQEGAKSLLIKAARRIVLVFKKRSKPARARHNALLEAELARINNAHAVQNINAYKFLKNAVVLLTHFNTDFTLLLALKRKLNMRIVCGSHDDIIIFAPQFAENKEIIHALFLTKYHMLYSADKIFCISNASKQSLENVADMCRVSRLPPPMAVIHLGQNGGAAGISGAADIPAPPRAHRDNFVLYVSSIEIRKNHITLLKAWQQLMREGFTPLPDLLCIGKSGWNTEDMRDLYHNDPALRQKVHFYSDVRDAELDLFYKRARFSVFPSHGEGWGLAAAESLYHGVPCIISTCPALKEATQNLMPAVEATDVSGWVAAVKEFCSDVVLASYTEAIRRNFRVRRWNDFTRDVVAYCSEGA